MALWEPSLLMSIINVRLTSDVVKPKANIYNDLRTFYRIDCIAGRPGRAGNAGQVTISVIEIFQQPRFRQLPSIAVHRRTADNFHSLKRLKGNPLRARAS